MDVNHCISKIKSVGTWLTCHVPPLPINLTGTPLRGKEQTSEAKEEKNVHETSVLTTTAKYNTNIK